ncbi:MAG: acetylxylan esterase, partial [Mycobacteriales bacterium]
PYAELLSWCRTHPDLADQAFSTLSYFDVAVLGATATAPALFSVAMHDPTCPPSTVFAAYNNYGGDKDIRIWSWHEHEGGQSRQRAEQVAWLAKTLSAS